MKVLFMRSFGSVMLAIFACSLLAQTNGPHYVGNSPNDFVEGFYSWYVPHNMSGDSIAGRSKHLRLIRSELSPQLAKLLEEDSAAQAKCRDLIGLDFDPFLYTQEPAQHYKVGRMVQTKTGYSAYIYRLESGKIADQPDVIADFAQREGHWYFVNFHYPGGSDLLTQLKSRSPCTTPR
jgi:hypothetical protein